MVVHIDPSTGNPIFIVDQILLVKELKVVYDKYGIHGIHYCFLYGWAASPFSTETNKERRHELVAKQVYESHYYDPIIQDLVKKEKMRTTKQYESPEIVYAIDMINKLGRVPILEEKQTYLTVGDKIRDALLADLDTRTAKALSEQSAAQKNLLANQKETSRALREVIELERALLAKKDEQASLNDFFV